MRWETRNRLWNAGAVAFGVFVLLFCSYQVYSAVAHGTILQLVRGGDWVTYDGNPIWFVCSFIGYIFFLALAGALVGLGLFEHRMVGRWRARQDVDHAIRQAPEER